MTVAEYARHRGCSRRAVYDAIRAGRIARLPGGRIDPVAADRAWKVNTLPHVGGKRRAKAKGRTPVSAEGVAAGETDARTLLRKGAADVLSFADARRARELVRLARETFELRKMQADTFSKAEVDRYVFKRIRMVRDVLLTIPAREVATGAAELRIDEGDLYRWLAGVLRRFCQQQSEEPAAEAVDKEDNDGSL